MFCILNLAAPLVRFSMWLTTHFLLVRRWAAIPCVLLGCRSAICPLIESFLLIVGCYWSAPTAGPDWPQPSTWRILNSTSCDIGNLVEPRWLTGGSQAPLVGHCDSHDMLAIGPSTGRIPLGLNIVSQPMSRCPIGRIKVPAAYSPYHSPTGTTAQHTQWQDWSWP